MQITINGTNLDVPQEEFEKLKKKYGEKKRWRAEKGEKYYFSDFQSSCSTSYTDTKSNVDNNLFKTGNYYKTKEEAQARIDLKKHIYSLIDKYGYIDENKYYFLDIRKDAEFWNKERGFILNKIFIKSSEEIGRIIHINSTPEEREERLELLKKVYN